MLLGQFGLKYQHNQHILLMSAFSLENSSLEVDLYSFWGSHLGGVLNIKGIGLFWTKTRIYHQSIVQLIHDPAGEEKEAEKSRGAAPLNSPHG